MNAIVQQRARLARVRRIQHGLAASVAAAAADRVQLLEMNHERLRRMRSELQPIAGPTDGAALARMGELGMRLDGARLSRATIKVFPHKDVDAARAILKELPAGQRKLLITDGVFSMDGDLGPLPDLCAAAEDYGAIMMVDDAHASGVFGKNGSGTVDHFGCHGRVDIQVSTRIGLSRDQHRRLRFLERDSPFISVRP